MFLIYKEVKGNWYYLNEDATRWCCLKDNATTYKVVIDAVKVINKYRLSGFAFIIPYDDKPE